MRTWHSNREQVNICVCVPMMTRVLNDFWLLASTTLNQPHQPICSVFILYFTRLDYPTVGVGVRVRGCVMVRFVSCSGQSKIRVSLVGGVNVIVVRVWVAVRFTTTKNPTLTITHKPTKSDT